MVVGVVVGERVLVGFEERFEAGFLGCWVGMEANGEEWRVVRETAIGG